LHCQSQTTWTQHTDKMSEKMEYKSTTQKVKEIRTALKNEFPALKFSITKRDYNSMYITILSGNVDFDTTYSQVNNYWFEEHYTGQALETLKRIFDIANNMADITYRETGDYGNQPSFYIYVSIGDWNKPYTKIGECNLGMAPKYLPEPKHI
jgi:hypothetical protein